MAIKKITIYTADEFQKWLAKNHNAESHVQLVLYKKHTGKKFPLHRELLDEAICYGWIDTTIKRIDENRYLRNFVQRNENSSWSANTLSYAKKLIADGRMTKHGLAFYKEGLTRPVHDAGIPKNPRMPQILFTALKKNAAADKNFRAFSPSVKKMTYRWLLSAKRDDTKEKRVKKIVAHAKNDKKIF